MIKKNTQIKQQLFRKLQIILEHPEGSSAAEVALMQKGPQEAMSYQAAKISKSDNLLTRGHTTE